MAKFKVIVSTQSVFYVEAEDEDSAFVKAEEKHHIVLTD